MAQLPRKKTGSGALTLLLYVTVCAVLILVELARNVLAAL